MGVEVLRWSWRFLKCVVQIFQVKFENKGWCAVLQEPGIIFRSAMFWKRPIIWKAVALCLLEFPCYHKCYFLWENYLEIWKSTNPNEFWKICGILKAQRNKSMAGMFMIVGITPIHGLLSCVTGKKILVKIASQKKINLGLWLIFFFNLGIFKV